MKKGATPELRQKWWKDNKATTLKKKTGIGAALKDYEDAVGGKPPDYERILKALDAVKKKAKAAVGMCSTKHHAETKEALEKYPGIIKVEKTKIEKEIEAKKKKINSALLKVDVKIMDLYRYMEAVPRKISVVRKSMGTVKLDKTVVGIDAKFQVNRQKAYKTWRELENYMFKVDKVGEKQEALLSDLRKEIKRATMDDTRIVRSVKYLNDYIQAFKNNTARIKKLGDDIHDSTRG